MALPTESDLTNASTTNAQQKTNLAGIRNFIANVFGTTETAASARTSLGFTAAVVNRAYAEYTANANLTANIPPDDTIPQITEGTQILSVSLTPKSTTSRIRLRFQGCIAADTANAAFGVALFSSASANALRSALATVDAIGSVTDMVVEHEYVPGVSTALTFSVRVGPLGGATFRMNGNATSRFFGGSLAATLVVEEIAG